MKFKKPIEDLSTSLAKLQLAMELNDKLRFISNQLKKNYHLIAREAHHDTDCFKIYNSFPNMLSIFIPQTKYFIYIKTNYYVRICNSVYDDVINAKAITTRKCLKLIDDNYLVYCLLRIYEYIYHVTNE